MGLFARRPEAFRHIKALWMGQAAAMPSIRPVLPVCPPSVAIMPSPTTVTGHALKLRSIQPVDNGTGSKRQTVRVVISGRMADVCAELDRLVALEAQPTLH